MRYIAVKPLKMNDGSILAAGQLLPESVPMKNPSLWIRQGHIAPAPEPVAPMATAPQANNADYKKSKQSNSGGHLRKG